MKNILISDVSKYEKQIVRLKGWITHVRHSGKLIFIEVRDGTGTIQGVIISGDVEYTLFEATKHINIETSVVLDGIIRSEKRSKTGFEINVSNLEIIHQPESDYPITTKEHGVSFLLENRHLWLRSSRQEAILKIRANIINSSREYFDSQGFILFDAPILTPVACEGTTTLFETQYFDMKAFLTQSGQLYNEAGAMALGRVYSCGPTFRAERSKTRRHLTEFWMIEPEAAFYDLEMIIELSEKYVVFIIQRVLEKNKKELESLERDSTLLEKITYPFPKMSYDDAINMLQKKSKSTIQWGGDLGAEDETIISNNFEKPVIIFKYPSVCKAFYMKNDPERNDVVLSFDMLAPEGYGEIIGGGQREDVYLTLKEKINRNGLNEEHLMWYLDLRRYGSVPHAGFGLGFERTIAWICGLKHVRETIPFPRMLDKIWP